MSTLFWVVVAAALVWAVLKLSRSSGSGRSDGDSSAYYSDGGSSVDCSNSSGDGASCDGGGGDGGGGD